jgi:hypothetical protein
MLRGGKVWIEEIRGLPALLPRSAAASIDVEMSVPAAVQTSSVDSDQRRGHRGATKFLFMFRHPLMCDLARLSVAKLAILGLIYALFFSPSHRAPIDPAERIAGSVSSSASNR